MLYAILGHESRNGLALRVRAGAAHLQYLRALQDSGRLVVAGALPRVDAVDPGAAGYQGDVVIGEFDDLAHAQAWADDDPYVVAGVYERVEVYPFAQALATAARSAPR